MQKVASDIMVGTDVEMFLFDNELGKIVPSVGILPGTKEKPYRPNGCDKGFAIQEDNVMVEYNVPPASDYTTFTIQGGQAQLMVLDELRCRYGNKYSLYRSSSTHMFMPKDLRSSQAQTIGCEPDFDAYNGGSMRKEAPVPTHLRTCGGHIHLGGDFNCPDFVAALFAELFFGVRCNLQVRKSDPRTVWYGRPGVFRPKPYGIEYRTPNSEWAMSESKRSYVGEAALKVATWLTHSDAMTIQKAFRGVKWVMLRDYMMAEPALKSTKQARATLNYDAQKLGVPI